MGTTEIIGMLIAERDRIERAIQALGNPSKRRGRPPESKGATAGIAAPGNARGRKPMTAAQKKAHSERMKAFWAARRKMK
jgi:hypothetical protein